MQSKEPIPYQVLSGLSEICEISTDCLLGMSRKSREADLDNVLPSSMITKLQKESAGYAIQILLTLLRLF